MRLVFAGTPEPAVTALETLLASRHDVVAVVTRPDAPSGRGRRLHPSPVAARAAEEGLTVLTPRRASDPAFLQELADLEPDCCPVVAYGNLLRPAALAVPRVGWINLHFSLLPAWRGAAPVQHAILAGDEITGASTFLIEEGLDTGPVFGTLTEPIHPSDTAGALLDRLAVSGAALLVATLDGVEDGTLTAVPQADHGVSLAPKITTDDARVDFGAPALRVDRQIRACTPAPGAWTWFRGERLKLAPVRLAPAEDGPAPGEIAVRRGAVLVGTASHAVELTTVQPPGRRPMPAGDWARGARIGAERLGIPPDDGASDGAASGDGVSEHASDVPSGRA